MTLKAAILGASGYTGAELVRLLATHPQIEIAALSADRKAGQSYDAVFPHLRHLSLPPLVRMEEIDFSGAQVREYAETLAALQTMGQELTASLQAQWKMEQQQREQIIQLSHELKTPLAVIEGNADLLAEDEALTPEQREQVEAILRGTEQTRTYLLKIRAQVQTPLKYKRP